MEATKSRGKTSKRKPFTDLSNITPSSLPSSIKFKPQTSSSHSLPLKSLLNNADLNSDANSTSTGSPVNHNVNNDKKNKKDKVKGPSNTTNPSSSLSLPPKTPAVSVYKRRHTAEKRKDKGKEIMEPLSFSLETRMPSLRWKKTYGDDDVVQSKSCPMPCRKKRRRKLPKDFIDKQRAYFAEVDAFELEEEVASADESE
ncbi:hypothetical protein GQ457_05G021600 [Hibiscus cannabinus]